MAKLISKHDAAYRQLRERIAGGEYAPGAALPAESALTREYGISRTAVRQALGRLVAEGLIRRRKGSGSVVTAEAPEILASRPGLRLALVVPYGQLVNPVHLGLARCLQDQPRDDLAVRLLCDRRPNFARYAALGIDYAVIDGSLAPEPPREWTARTILFNRASPRHNFVTTDNFAGGRALARHLAEQGHQRLGVIHFGERDEPDFADRLRGFRAWVAEAGLPPAREIAIALHNFRALPPRAAASQMLTAVRQGEVTGVALVTDLLALPLYAAAEDAGLLPGRDFALIGYDDQPFARFLSPSLTTLRQPLEAIAAAILRAVQRGAADPRRVDLCHDRLPPTLQLRESSARRAV